MISDELRSGTESPQPFGTQGSDSVLEQWEDARDGPPFEFGHHEKLVDAADKLAEAYLALLKQTKAERAEHVVRDLIRMEKRAAKAEAENERLRVELDSERKSNADLSESIDELIKERDELEQSLDFRHKADQRAIKRWHDAGGDPLVWPDQVDLLVWLMEQLKDK